MARHGKKMTYPERLECGKRATAGQTDVQYAQATGWSIWTVRKWRRSFQKQGESGIVPLMGRPKKGALSTYPDDLGTGLKKMRQAHPGWGPITLLEELTALPAYFGKALPSRARVAAFLKEKQLVRQYERHAGLPQPAPDPATQVHDEWEMDAQGRQPVAGLGMVNVVNIMDVVSRLKVESYPQLWGRVSPGRTTSWFCGVLFCNMACLDGSLWTMTALFSIIPVSPLTLPAFICG